MQQRIGNYQILERIAAGGQATVFRAWDQRTGQIVAVKVLHEHLSGDAVYLERFRREAQLAASISHPNVVRIFEVGHHDQSYFMTQEYLPVSLHDVMRAQGQMPVERAVAITVQIALGLQAAAARGIVHRDIKPRNVLIDADGVAKVTDFGISRAEALSTMTRTGAVMGTPHYMSPEQARGDTVDVRADLYALGVVLFQMLAAKVPFDADTPYEIIRQHIEVRPQPVRRLRGDVPRELERVVSRCLEKDPARRYQTPAALITALQQTVPSAGRSAAGGRQARPSSPRPQAQPLPAVAPAPASAASAVARRARSPSTTWLESWARAWQRTNRRRFAWTGAVLSIAIVLALGTTGLRMGVFDSLLNPSPADGAGAPEVAAPGGDVPSAGDGPGTGVAAEDNNGVPPTGDGQGTGVVAGNGTDVAVPETLTLRIDSSPGGRVLLDPAQPAVYGDYVVDTVVSENVVTPRPGATVTLTAMPDSGFVFGAWTGTDLATPSVASVEITVDRAMTITAIFRAAGPAPTPTSPTAPAATATPTTAPPAAAADKPTVIFSELNWDSAQIQNAIARRILEEGYGYETDAVSGGAAPLMAALISGQTNITMEISVPNQQPAYYDAAIATGTIWRIGNSREDNWQATFIIPQYTADANPGLRSVSDLPDYAHLFVTPDSNGRARLLNCISGWECEWINEKKISVYGLGDSIWPVNPGSGAALEAEIRAAFEKKEDILFYYWGPTTLSYDLENDLGGYHILEEPPYSDECWSRDVGCAYQTTEVVIAMHEDLLEQAPDLIEFFEKWEFSAGIQRQAEAYLSQSGAGFPDVADWFLTNTTEWKSWVAPGVADDVLAAITIPLVD